MVLICITAVYGSAGHTRQKKEAVWISFNQPGWDQGYPGNAKIRISYTLTEDNCVKIDYNMVSDADTVANFTNHCYFNLAGHNSGPVLDQQVWLAADSYTPADATSIPTGEILPVAGTPMDLEK